LAELFPRCKFRELVDILQDRPSIGCSGEDAAGQFHGPNRVTQGEKLPLEASCAWQERRSPNIGGF